MTHGASQPTLPRACSDALETGLAPLDLTETAGLLAFHRATREPHPIAPCFALTQELGSRFERYGILKVCGEHDALNADLPQQAIYDPISWRYDIAVDGLEATLDERLTGQIASDGNFAQRASLWRSLASAELEGYFAHLLRRHGFDPRWAAEARDSGHRWDRGISLAQARYVAWASVREAAAVCLRSAGDSDEVRDALTQEFRRRSAWVEARRDWGASFIPTSDARRSLLLTIFFDSVAPIGSRYWHVAPSPRSLREIGAPLPEIR